MDKRIEMVMDWLVVVAAVHVGLVAWLGFNIVETLAGYIHPFLATILYTLIGASGIVFLLRKFGMKILQ